MGTKDSRNPEFESLLQKLISAEDLIGILGTLDIIVGDWVNGMGDIAGRLVDAASEVVDLLLRKGDSGAVREASSSQSLSAEVRTLLNRLLFTSSEEPPRKSPLSGGGAPMPVEAFDREALPKPGGEPGIEFLPPGEFDLPGFLRRRAGASAKATQGKQVLPAYSSLGSPMFGRTHGERIIPKKKQGNFTARAELKKLVRATVKQRREKQVPPALRRQRR
jgi:hypothetical protein